MSDMDISTRLDFASDPMTVYAMMIDFDFMEQVCVASQSRTFAVSADGGLTHTSRTLAAPESAARFTGSELTVIEDINWGSASSDGARTADLTMTVLGQPVKLTGKLTLAAGGRGTIIDLNGELKVAIPLLGRKIEQSSAPAVMAGFRTQQQVGDRWLA